jgi:hypothetical protein
VLRAQNQILNGGMIRGHHFQVGKLQRRVEERCLILTIALDAQDRSISPADVDVGAVAELELYQVRERTKQGGRRDGQAVWKRIDS